MAQLSRENIRKIKQIQINTTQLADDMLAGAWHSAFKGMGMEFEEVREYQTGDDIRSIDWNVTARMNHPFVKVFREERELTVMLVVDVSASSRFGTQNQLKKDLIAEIGGVLAFSAIKNNDKIGLLLYSDRVEKIIPPKKGTRHVLRVIRELLAFQPSGTETNLESALHYVGGILRKKSICFFISDFLCDLHPHELGIISKKHDMIAISVTDPRELEFPKMDLVTLKDLETGAMHIVDSSDQKLLAAFQEKNRNRLEETENLMKKIGAGYIDIRTDASYVLPMRKFFKLREVRS